MWAFTDLNEILKDFGFAEDNETLQAYCFTASVAQLDVCHTGDQDVTESIPTGSVNTLSLRLMMNIF